MIGRLRGAVAEVGEEEALIDVGGVGYVVRCGSRTLSRLPAIGDETLLHIDSQTREDGTRLYGFLAREDRAAFVMLQGIQGVGPKAALSVLDVMTPGELAGAVAREDKALVARAQGVGPKLALRIVVELKGKPLGAGLAVEARGRVLKRQHPRHRRIALVGQVLHPLQLFVIEAVLALVGGELAAVAVDLLVGLGRMLARQGAAGGVGGIGRAQGLRFRAEGLVGDRAVFRREVRERRRRGDGAEVALLRLQARQMSLKP